MKNVSQKFKDAIREYGRQIDVIITYNDGREHILDSEVLFSVTPNFNANILKSVMKGLDFESSVKVPKNTVIDVKFGILIDNSLTVEEVNEMKVSRVNELAVKYLTGELKGFEYLDLGEYIVSEEPEYNADTNSYSHKCYDKLLYSMKEYESLNVTYPCTIQTYLNAICTKLGYTLQTAQLLNLSRIIPSELYENLGYTYRDVLDEIAEALGCVIYIKDDQTTKLVLGKPVETTETIDEESLKDVNVSFGEKYGPINSIVLSRAGESDNVYLKDDASIEENGLCEVKIIDNQIMNFNNRSDFLPGIADSLFGLEYYLNDYSSTGIMYLELLDFYNVQIGEDIYKCLMLNDEQNITQGLVEDIYTDIPEVSETDYTKADKTDQRINQTYIIVDKQNQRIDSVVSNVTEQNNKISQITQTVDELNSRISDIADVTIYGESERLFVELDGINNSEPIMVKVHPTATNISYLYPRENLYPNNNLTIPVRTIRFTRTYNDSGTTVTEDIDYEIPDDLLRYNSETYDEFYLDYESQTCQVTKRCGYNADGTVYVLSNPIVTDYPYPTIILGDGDYDISMPGYDYGYLYVRLMASNIYTTQFTTKAEVSSAINQSAQSIDLSVDTKLENYSTTTEMNSAITLKANEINSTVSQKVGKNEVISSINQSAEAVTINAGKINLNGVITANSNFKIKSDGSMEAKNGTFKGDIVIPITNRYDENEANFLIEDEDGISTWVNGNGFHCKTDYAVFHASCNNYAQIYISNGSNYSSIKPSGITTPKVTQTSLEKDKKNFESFNNALDIIKSIDIYKYNLKDERDATKKHIGFIIGDNFKYSKDVTSENNDGVDIYSFVSLCCQAIKEQQEQIEKLEKRLEDN